MSAYKNFALLYDELMKDAPYNEWIRFTNDILQTRNVSSVVDLGCGTGEIILRLAEDGRELFGVDLSDDMLAIAEQKAIHTNVDVTWIKQDIRSLQGFHDVDLMISYCDVINYITEASDLVNVFSNANKSLAEDGLFIFDVHSLAHVERNLTNRTFTYKDESLAYIWDCFAGDIEGDMYHDMTFFYQAEQNSSLYNRIDEIHHQRTYTVEKYIEL